jgi:hypothetical protein
MLLAVQSFLRRLSRQNNSSQGPAQILPVPPSHAFGEPDDPVRIIEGVT